MLYTAEKQPAVFFATCARLIGPKVKLTIEQNYAGLSPNELVLLKEVMASINEGLPNAATRPPGEVFEHVLSALRERKESRNLCRRPPAGMASPIPSIQSRRCGTQRLTCGNCWTGLAILDLLRRRTMRGLGELVRG